MHVCSSVARRTILARPHRSYVTRVQLITGSFGAGKTTAIRRLMAGKPEAELWVVVLNEFTDAGIDALSVAQSARGSFDVRLVAGGCLCCVGELEFGRQLREILRSYPPARLLIEPSGAGHAADIVDVLGGYQSQGALTLESIVCLVDSQDAVRIDATRPETEWSQIQSADALLLSKPDLADAGARAAFSDIAAAQYPAKAFVGECLLGEIPLEAMQPLARTQVFSMLRAQTSYSAPVGQAFELQGRQATESSLALLGHHGVQWQMPADLRFARVVLEPRLRWMAEAYGGYLVRMKGVFRTGPGPGLLLQSAQGRALSVEDSAYRRDSRLEIVVGAAPSASFLNEWRQLLRDAANP